MLLHLWTLLVRTPFTSVALFANVVAFLNGWEVLDNGTTVTWMLLAIICDNTSD